MTIVDVISLRLAGWWGGGRVGARGMRRPYYTLRSLSTAPATLPSNSDLLISYNVSTSPLQPPMFFYHLQPLFFTGQKNQ